MDASRFWYGVALRALRDTTAGNTALREVASRPGYEFYRVAARESLGVRWRDTRVYRIPVEYGPFPLPSCGDYSAVLALAAIGDTAEAFALVDILSVSPYRRNAWSREDHCDFGVESIFGAALGHALGNPRAAIQLAIRALPDPNSQNGVYRSRIAWSYPVLMAAAGVESSSLAMAMAIERERIMLGAGAKLGGDPPRLESLRGAFGGSVAIALRALRSGKSAPLNEWQKLYVLGGDALVCEITADSPDATFARNVLAAHSAYRELAPW